MRQLELLAPARNLEIGIAAIDCGADAVYIAGPDFGARKAAGNSFDDIRALCDHAHKFGARVFVTFNTIVPEEEQQELKSQMVRAQQAGADAFIIRDGRICGWPEITVPLHASTQCAIRTPERARLFEDIGCGRVVLERELSLSQIRSICKDLTCEVEAFVHGALCVCYSGDCRLSEHIDGRSADRGECIQACRSLYDLVDEKGRTLLRNKPVLSLKDLNLKSRLEELADAGVSSFKIEGRLKNISYVKNVVRDYDLALEALVAAYPDRYCRASWGRVNAAFMPDTGKTFNRGYTQLFIDGKRRQGWASADAAKSMGEAVGSVENLLRRGSLLEIHVRCFKRGTSFSNGDGFAYVCPRGVEGFRAERCEGNVVWCREAPRLSKGMTLFRNIDTRFEKQLAAADPSRELAVKLDIEISESYRIVINALTEDGRRLSDDFTADLERANDRARMEEMLRAQLSKRSGHYSFSVGSIRVHHTPGGSLPLLSASTINSFRRLIASDLDALPCNAHPLNPGKGRGGGAGGPGAEQLQAAAARRPGRPGELMRTKYCVKFELGLCPLRQGAAPTGRLFLLNNKRRFELHFDCNACEMTVTDAAA